MLSDKHATLYKAPSFNHNDTSSQVQRPECSPSHTVAALYITVNS